MTGTLEGKVAVVTGGTGALGRAVVRHLLLAKAAVHVTWVNAREVSEFQTALGDAAANVTLHEVDVTDPPAVDALFAKLVEQPGRIDVLANIVGGFAYAPVTDTTPELWQRMLGLNATSAFLCSRAAIPLFRSRGGGRIVNVASEPALERGAANMSAYSAAKAAVLNFTYSLSKELVRDAITVNAVVPSIIDTPANRRAQPDADTSTWLSPDDIAAVIGFLASDAGAIVTGTAMHVSRG